jgi:hypothetical protein
LKPRRVAAMRGSTADRIEDLIANHKVDVCTIGPERVITRQPEIRTGLPPAVLPADDPQLAMLKTPAHIRELERLERASLSPDKIAKFLDVIRNDWGFNIYRAVSVTKVKLSAAQRTNFVLKLGDIDIEREISRADFERWIAHDIQRIEETVDDLLDAEGVRVDDID